MGYIRNSCHQKAGTCTIGGNLSTNAGGTTALAYGVARSHVLGIEVMLADAQILENLNKLKKDNTGYDLKNLFIEAEGTLGVITAAVLQVVPRPRSIETAVVGFFVSTNGTCNSRNGG
jgi:FAD/FMN-containing dehydrogenase